MYLGRERSLAKLCVELGRPAGYTRYLEIWSSKYDWVKRVAAWDAHVRAEEMKKRKLLVEEAEQKAFDLAGDALDQLGELAMHSEKESVQLGAIKEILRITGVGEREEELPRVDLRIVFPNNRRKRDQEAGDE